jgi:hypothetical protein
MNSIMCNTIAWLEGVKLPSQSGLSSKFMNIMPHFDLWDQFGLAILALLFYTFKPGPPPPKGWFIPAWGEGQTEKVQESSRVITKTLEKAVCIISECDASTFTNNCRALMLSYFGVRKAGEVSDLQTS